jgi:hypothetical protein
LSRIDKASRVELGASGSTVEIISIPCQFHAPKYALLEQLFIPLLSSAQQANDLMGLRVGDDKSAHRAASYMAGELLRDETFGPVRSLMASAAHAFLIDFVGNNFQAETSVFSAGGGKASLFRLKVTGAIRGDKFVVEDPSTNNTLFSFTRFEADKPNFFARDFPFLASEARKEHAASTGGPAELVHGVIDLMLGVPVGGKTITVRVQKQAETLSVEIKHPSTNETVMSIPLAALSNIAKLAETIAKHLSSNATAFDLTP